MQALADHFGIDQLAHGLKQRVVALHQVGDAEAIAGVGQLQQLISLGQVERQRLFADHMLACLQGCTHLAVMEEGRRGDVNKVNLIEVEQALHIEGFSNSKTAGHGEGRLSMGASHGHQLRPFNL